MRRVLIVGGVAGGASCAARLRRVDENCEIVVFERGPYVSFANCGLPYYVGDVIQEEKKLLVATPELFQSRFNIEVRTHHEVVGIDRAAQEVDVVDLQAGRAYRDRYDALVLAPGATPIRPSLPGADLEGIFTVRTIPDSRTIRAWIEERRARRAVVVGAGFIGLEMVENLARRGLEVTVLEAASQVMPMLDAEMASYVEAHLRAHGVSVHTSDPVAAFARTADGALKVTSSSGAEWEADLVILAIGVRPETGLAAKAGLELGSRGGIRVDQAMRTSDPHIWAVGDAVEVKDLVTGEWCVAPLAGPANRQGRVAADSIAGRQPAFRGVQSTVVCGCLGLTMALTGATEKRLNVWGGCEYESVYLHPGHHSAYYPGAKPIHMKLTFRKPDGLLLGAQAVGEKGVERRIDVLSMALQKQATVFDLEEAELCYAPQYGAAKDPVNVAGMIAANLLRGDVRLARWEEAPATDAYLVDVREPHEYGAGHVPGATNVPLSRLRSDWRRLPRDREIWVYCAAGQRSYYAARLLAQLGFAVRNLPGGYQTYKAFALRGLTKP